MSGKTNGDRKLSRDAKIAIVGIIVAIGVGFSGYQFIKDKPNLKLRHIADAPIFELSSRTRPTGRGTSGTNIDADNIRLVGFIVTNAGDSIAQLPQHIEIRRITTEPVSILQVAVARDAVTNLKKPSQWLHDNERALLELRGGEHWRIEIQSNIAVGRNITFFLELFDVRGPSPLSPIFCIELTSPEVSDFDGSPGLLSMDGLGKQVIFEGDKRC